uniref:Cyclin-dependent kinase 9 (CDC2-related kinase) n=1 Tax=Myripristis murdjan TaxID=586833 RepID=A0A667WTB0_9TELE
RHKHSGSKVALRKAFSIYLVSDLCEHDLEGLLSNASVKFTLAEIKKVMQMLLNGLYCIHGNKILHRDMKAGNVLITKDGVLKLADFGLAWAFSLAKNSQGNRYTNCVRDYGPPVDLWGAGCIVAEMWTRTPIVQGSTEQHQLTLISQLYALPENRAPQGPKEEGEGPSQSLRQRPLRLGPHRQTAGIMLIWLQHNCFCFNISSIKQINLKKKMLSSVSVITVVLPWLQTQATVQRYNGMTPSHAEEFMTGILFTLFLLLSTCKRHIEYGRYKEQQNSSKNG